MFTPAIRAIYFPSSAPRVWGLRRENSTLRPENPTLAPRPSRRLVAPFQTKSRRAHKCAAGRPVDRDRLQIGVAPGRVKAGDLCDLQPETAQRAVMQQN